MGLASSRLHSAYVLRVAPAGAPAYECEVFAKVRFSARDDADDFVARACAAFPRWAAGPGAVALFLVPGGREAALALQRDPPSAARALAGDALLPDARVAPGSWLLARIAPPARAPADDASAVTPAAYEARARLALPALLEERCGLRVVADASVHRGQPNDILMDGRSVEWDFRAPVVILATEPAASAASEGFQVYPTHARYNRPSRPPALRNLTPTKTAGGAVAACHFIAIFEVTTAEKWSRALLGRLERRLCVSLDRARSQEALGDINSVLDVVAVVGVVSPFNCLQSVTFKLANDASLVQLRAMAAARRFVWIDKDLSPSEADE
jgi:hypothetical protein